MFFTKKKSAESKTIPTSDIDKLISDGMSDKDIIKKLKSEGYSYDEIEKAMLAAVKKGVGGEAPAPSSKIAEMRSLPAQAGPLPDPDTGIGEFSQRETFPAPPTANEELMDISEKDIEDISPETIVEELVEGVVEEKWKRFDDSLERVNGELNSLKDAIRNIEKRPAAGGQVSDARLQEIDTKIEDLSVRIGGLEKAFKQFLPSLTRNIENLSNVVHEIRQRRPA